MVYKPGTHHVVIDHCSISWGVDENISLYDDAHHVTFSWNIVSEGLANSTHEEGEHSKGAHLSGERTYDISFHHNLLAHNNDRNPQPTNPGFADVRNNVDLQLRRERRPDVQQPRQDPLQLRRQLLQARTGHRPRASTSSTSTASTSVGWAFFVEGNIGPHRTSDSQAAATYRRPGGRPYMVPDAFPFPSTRTTSAAQAYNEVLADAGADVQHRDAVDRRIVRDVRHSTGHIIDDPAEVGGWPVLPAATAAPDSDQDGMPNAWEQERGLNPDRDDSRRDATATATPTSRSTSPGWSPDRGRLGPPYGVRGIRIGTGARTRPRHLDSPRKTGQWGRRMTGSDRASLARSRRLAGGPNLTGRASLNAVASFLEYGVRALVELVVTPLLVGGLGASMYGAWRVLWQWTGYVWGASGRSAQALQYAIANRQWTASTSRSASWSALRSWSGSCSSRSCWSAGASGVWLAPVLLDVPASQVGELRLAAAVLVLDALAVTVATLPRSTLQGENLGYVRMSVTPVMVAVGGALLVLAVKLGLGLPGVAAATLDHDAAHGRRLLEGHPPAAPVVRHVSSLARDRALVPPPVLVVPGLEVRPRADDRQRRAGARRLRAARRGGRVRPHEVRRPTPSSRRLSLLVQATIPGIGGHVGRRPDRPRRRAPRRGARPRVGRRDRGRRGGGDVERELHRASGSVRTSSPASP